MNSIISSPVLTSEKPILHFGIISVFPNFFSILSEEGMTARAIKKKKIEIQIKNPRKFSGNRYKSIDNRPYGGGPGMVLRYEPIKKSHEQLSCDPKFKQAKTIYFSPRGNTISQKSFRECALSLQPLIFICGRYEGIDQRLIESLVDEEWSLGDYVISGGELAAMVCIDGMAREIPDVLNNENSYQDESFSNGLLEHPHYTKPQEIDGLTVPDVLLSGNHENIRRWKLQQSLGATWLKRPDLLDKRRLTKQEDCLLRAFQVEYLKMHSPESILIHKLVD